MGIRMTVPRGVLFDFKHQFDQGKLDAAHPVVKVAREALSQNWNGTAYLAIEVSDKTAAMINEYREKGREATEAYLQRHPKVRWVPEGGWNTGLSVTIKDEVLVRQPASQGRLQHEPGSRLRR